MVTETHLDSKKFQLDSNSVKGGSLYLQLFHFQKADKYSDQGRTYAGL